MTADDPLWGIDGGRLIAVVKPISSGYWRFDVTVGEAASGDALWSLLGATDIDTYGWARTREKCESKAAKRLAKIRRVLAVLAQKPSIVR